MMNPRPRQLGAIITSQNWTDPAAWRRYLDNTANTHATMLNPLAWFRSAAEGIQRNVVEPLTTGVADSIKGTYQPPNRPQAPQAPQTAADMLSWTPEKLWAADNKAWHEWKAGALPDPPEDNSLAAYAALAAGAVVLYLGARLVVDVIAGGRR